MFIKIVTIKGFRDYGENVMEFHEGINVLIAKHNDYDNEFNKYGSSCLV